MQLSQRYMAGELTGSCGVRLFVSGSAKSLFIRDNGSKFELDYLYFMLSVSFTGERDVHTLVFKSIPLLECFMWVCPGVVVCASNRLKFIWTSPLDAATATVGSSRCISPE